MLSKDAILGIIVYFITSSVSLKISITALEKQHDSKWTKVLVVIANHASKNLHHRSTVAVYARAAESAGARELRS